MKKKILLLEDDPNLSLLLVEQLESNGFNVKHITNGEDGSREINSGYDLALVDIMMPKMDGLTFVKELRKINQQMPVIFLTAKSLKEDKLQGFKAGCDDYITKPFSMEELLLRIKAVLRRVSPSSSDVTPSKFQIGKYIFNSETQVLQFGNSKETLTSKESELLKMLCLHVNNTTEREVALKTIWGDDTIFNARSMDVYISKLRKYLKEDESIVIQNIHGKGYRLLTSHQSLTPPRNT